MYKTVKTLPLKIYHIIIRQRASLLGNDISNSSELLCWTLECFPPGRHIVEQVLHCNGSPTSASTRLGVSSSSRSGRSKLAIFIHSSERKQCQFSLDHSLYLLIGTLWVSCFRSDSNMCNVTDASQCLRRLVTLLQCSQCCCSVTYFSSETIRADTGEVFKLSQLARCESLAHNGHVFFLWRGWGRVDYLDCNV